MRAPGEPWAEVLALLPSHADQTAFCQAIEAAVREYVDGAPRDEQLREVYLQIKKQGGAVAIEKFCRAILELKKFPLDPIAEAMLQHVEPLKQIQSAADLRAAFYLTTSRRGRFMSRLSLAWTGPGRGEMPISDAGPFVDFMVMIAARVFARPLDGYSVKRFAKREQARRETLQVLNQLFAGQGGMKVDAFVIDAFGNHQSAG
jgi:hypothetical protein